MIRNKINIRKNLDYLSNATLNAQCKLTYHTIVSTHSLEDKDRELLIDIGYSNIPNSNNPLESAISSIDLESLEKIIIDYLKEINSKVNSILLTLRQRLKSSNYSPTTKEFKDFIPLDSNTTKNTYFKVFL